MQLLEAQTADILVQFCNVYLTSILHAEFSICSHTFFVHFYSNGLDGGLCVWIHQNQIFGILVAEQESQTSAVAC